MLAEPGKEIAKLLPLTISTQKQQQEGEFTIEYCLIGTMNWKKAVELKDIKELSRRSSTVC